MKRLLFFSVAIMHSFFLCGMKLTSPHPNLLYEEVCFLMSHNSFASDEEGFTIFNQQDLSIDDQLKHGVRGFMLDLWPGEGDQEGKIVLAHGDPSGVSKLQRLGKQHQTAKSLIKSLVAWLGKKKKKDEVLTLVFENYTSGEETKKMLASIEGFGEIVMTPRDWNSNVKGTWPTLEWMRNQNKRLVIFDRQAKSTYGYRPLEFVTQNMYGTYDVKKASRLRTNNTQKQKALFLLNYFNNVKSYVGQDTFVMDNYNSEENLKKVIKKCRKKGVINSDQKPNFIALNFVEEGDGLKLVNKINERAAETHELS